jgi:hypothetical protein
MNRSSCLPKAMAPTLPVSHSQRTDNLRQYKKALPVQAKRPITFPKQLVSTTITRRLVSKYEAFEIRVCFSTFVLCGVSHGPSAHGHV